MGGIEPSSPKRRHFVARTTPFEQKLVSKSAASNATISDRFSVVTARIETLLHHLAAKI